MKKMTLEELQRVEFDILDRFAGFCSEHHLRYYLCAGTLLGAIRHKGFIPWDDDIDVFMPRVDYIKFIELYKNGKFLHTLKIDAPNFEEGKESPSIMQIYNMNTFVKFTGNRIEKNIGCWIDIFPIDGLSDSKFVRWLHFYLVRALEIWKSLCITKIGSRRNSKFYTIAQYAFIVVLPIIRFIGYEKVTKYVNDLTKLYSYENSKYVGVLTGRAVTKETMQKKSMEPAIKVEFCGKEFYAPANYDEYLTNLYGDYMKLPPEEDRVPKHETEAYWKEL